MQTLQPISCGSNFLVHHFDVLRHLLCDPFIVCDRFSQVFHCCVSLFNQAVGDLKRLTHPRNLEDGLEIGSKA